MSSKIHDYIKKNIVEPTVQEKGGIVIAKVYSYDIKNNVAKISYTHQKQGGIIELDNVAVCLEREGFKGSQLQAGDDVLVQIYEGEYAVITQRIDKSYARSSKSRMSNIYQGGCLPDIMCQR